MIIIMMTIYLNEPVLFLDLALDLVVNQFLIRSLVFCIGAPLTAIPLHCRKNNNYCNFLSIV